MSEANRGEAQRCLEISQDYFRQRNLEQAYKYARKSVSLFQDAENKGWLETVSHQQSISNNTEPVINDNSAGQRPNLHTTQQPAQPNRQPLYSDEQAAQVKKFLSRDQSDYYSILAISKGASEIEIKKAYRKLALQFHPDKNSAPGADEAFKNLSRAFSILNDPEKRRQYDMFGSSPSHQAGGGNAARSFFGHAKQFDGDISPEDIFRTFFSAFDDDSLANLFTQNAFYPSQASHDRIRRRHHAHVFGNFARPHRSSHVEVSGLMAVLLQLLPFIILLVLSMFGSWFAESINPESHLDADQLVSLASNPKFPISRKTTNLGVPYYSSKQFDKYFDQSSLSPRHRAKLHQYEELIEKSFIHNLQVQCKEETKKFQEEALKSSNNPEKLRELGNERLPSCTALHKLGVK